MRVEVDREDGAVFLSLHLGPLVVWAVWGGRKAAEAGVLRGCGWELGPLSFKVTERG